MAACSKDSGNISPFHGKLVCSILFAYFLINLRVSAHKTLEQGLIHGTVSIVTQLHIHLTNNKNVLFETKCLCSAPIRQGGQGGILKQD